MMAKAQAADVQTRMLDSAKTVVTRLYKGVADQVIVVEDTSVQHFAACVRAPDASVCWWVTREAVE
jgi:hypothetical protein